MPRPFIRSLARTTYKPCLQRFLHASPSLKADITEPNHYETLEIPVNATPGEVKKSFYALSKTHHPDLNPSDPTAAQRFHKLSKAYHVLSDPSSRQQYDRETLHQTSHRAHRPSGSYHSTNQPGGRSPSGLSKRRSQFRGPPPSFYRSGGWGDHSAKRKSAYDSPSHSHPSQASTTSSSGGMGASHHPLGYGLSDDVPHFDREGHLRTGENVRKRRENMGKANSQSKASSNPKANARGWEEVQGAGDLPPTLWGSLLGMGLIIGLGVGVPLWWFEQRARVAQGWGKSRE